jgi:hypothetical protein
MDVTTENFNQVLQDLRNQVPVCDFIGIDCEFTGLEDASATPGKQDVNVSLAGDLDSGQGEAQFRFDTH